MKHLIMHHPMLSLHLGTILILLLVSGRRGGHCAKIDIRNLNFLKDDDNTPTPILIGYKSDVFHGTSSDGTAPRFKLSPSADLPGDGGITDGNTTLAQEYYHRTSPALSRVHAAKAHMTKAQVQELLSLHEDEILYIEEDSLLRPLTELIPYGVEAVQATGPYPPPISTSSSFEHMVSSCSNPNSFKIGLVDSGIDIRHPDLPCFLTNETQYTNCIGTSFGLGLTDEWYTPSDIHGTFVTGIMSAIRGNNLGITGVLNNDKICLIMARVFGGSVEEARLSDILDAVDWVSKQGAQIINLSLGGPTYSQTAENLYQTIRDENKLVFCASGNDGSNTLFYPASYSSTVSVGAIDSNFNRASFSQYNNEVDLVAPGVSILSTAPLGLGSLYLIDVNDGTTDPYDILLFGGSVVPPDSGLTGTLVECPNLGQDVCPGQSGSHICLIERGVTLFEEKALNCQQGGGIAAIMYNDESGLFSGGLATPTSVTIPVFAVSLETGQALIQNNLGSSITLVVLDGYTIADGTSFASPYAAGSAAAIWQSCPSCTNDEVENCMLSTARDLGPTGRDDQYGNGLVQVEDAYMCLVNTAGCCTLGETPSPAAAVAAAPTPTAATTDDSSTTADTCSSQDSKYKQCFAQNIDSITARATCRSCINGALPDNLNSTTCEELQASVCSATRGGCDCSSCGTSIEDYLTCILEDSANGCVINCDQYEANPTTPANFTLRYCTEEQANMEACLSVSPADGGSIPQQDQSCSSCLLSALPDSFSSQSCSEVNQYMCTLNDSCSCSRQCATQINALLSCAMRSNIAGCNLDCTASTSSAWTVRRWIVLLGAAAIALIL